ncbi:MAG TPA: hypothetical protein VHC22_33780 [Pirellulales bacterium]|nr:hypothetical protein [Pirellulales bacterium]
MKRLQFTLRALLVLLLAVACFFGGVHYLRREPPHVGETADAVEERWGTPHYDSRTSNGDPDGDYRLGYTDSLGTRYHLHVKGGKIVEIEYSSR